MSQTITQEAVRATVEEIAEENLVYRGAFRPMDASGINNDTMNVPVRGDALAQPQAIEPGAEFPTSREDYQKVSIDRQKYGFTTEITMEDQMDNVFDIVADHVDFQARKMAEKLDGLAFAELNSNLNDGSPAGDANGTLSFDDVVAGMEALELDLYSPDRLYVDPSGKADLLTDPDFNRASDLGDDVVQNGQIGEVAGVDVFYSNTGDLGQNDAVLVDTDYYGYEATWAGVSTRRGDDFDSQQDKIQVWTMKGWKAIEPEAAIKIDG